MVVVRVIGAGVIGLTTAARLADAGHRVTIVAEEFTPNTTSDQAGAVWYPFRAQPAGRVAAWSSATYRPLERLAATDPTAGVSMVDLFTSGLADDAVHPSLPTHRADALRRALPAECPPGITGGGTILRVPYCDTPVYMTWLMNLCARKGCAFDRRRVADLDAECREADVVVNCTGFGAKTLCRDPEMRGVSGHIVVVDTLGVAPATRYCVVVRPGEENQPIYIFPRPASGQYVIGGTTDSDRDGASVDPATARDVVSRAASVAPWVADARVVKAYVGVRPYRSAVRLEVQPGTNLIHNYGHGGAGYTVAEGCADEVVQLVKGVLAARRRRGDMAHL